MIRLSRLSDYGIVILSRLASEPGQPMAASTLARSTAVSTAMTGKILKALARAELVISQRGVRGGYCLARPPEAITVAAIIEALDGPIALTSCVGPQASVCGIESLCPTRASWQRINRAIREALAGITLAEMARMVPEAFVAVPPAGAPQNLAVRPAPDAGPSIGAG